MCIWKATWGVPDLSYCVNCGVELAPSEKVCPLCGVEVLNPAEPWTEPRERPYPQRVDKLVRHVDRRFFGLLMALIMQVPVWICIINDLLVNRRITWSLYVVGAMALLMVLAVVPLVVKKPKALLLILADGLAILGFLLLIDWMEEGIQWFSSLALPLTAAFVLIAELFALWFRGRRPVLITLGMICIAAGLYTLCVELILNAYRHLPLMPQWAWYSFVPCLLAGGMFMVLNRRNRWRESIKKRLFF